MSIEVQKAIEMGYTVKAIQAVWRFENRVQYDAESKTGRLFTEYTNTFLKFKQEASSWPQWVMTNEDRERYIREYYENEGIHLGRK